MVILRVPEGSCWGVVQRQDMRLWTVVSGFESLHPSQLDRPPGHRSQGPPSLPDTRFRIPRAQRRTRRRSRRRVPVITICGWGAGAHCDGWQCTGRELRRKTPLRPQELLQCRRCFRRQRTGRAFGEGQSIPAAAPHSTRKTGDVLAQFSCPKRKYSRSRTHRRKSPDRTDKGTFRW